MGLKRSCAKCGRVGCPGHMRKRILQNPTRRGYDAEYQRNRKLMIDIAWENKLPCCRCGGSFEKKSDITADHWIPKRLGGTNQLSNLRPAHKPCNSSAGASFGNRLRKRNGV